MSIYYYDILLMIVVPRVDVNKFLNHDKNILNAVFSDVQARAQSPEKPKPSLSP